MKPVFGVWHRLAEVNIRVEVTNYGSGQWKDVTLKPVFGVWHRLAEVNIRVEHSVAV